MVAYTTVNVYVWTLVFLQWPVKVYLKEYEIKEIAAAAGPKQELKDFDNIEAAGANRDENFGFELNDLANGNDYP